MYEVLSLIVIQASMEGTILWYSMGVVLSSRTGRISAGEVCLGILGYQESGKQFLLDPRSTTGATVEW